MKLGKTASVSGLIVFGTTTSLFAKIGKLSEASSNARCPCRFDGQLYDFICLLVPLAARFAAVMAWTPKLIINVCDRQGPLAHVD
jgi:hypothetical protein